MRVECVFCGFESYGVDGLKAHSATCQLHPITAERDQLRAEVEAEKKQKRLLQWAVDAHSRNLLEHGEALAAATARAEAAEKALGEAKKALEQIYWHHETIEAMEREAKDAIAAIATSAKGEN